MSGEWRLKPSEDPTPFILLLLCTARSQQQQQNLVTSCERRRPRPRGVETVLMRDCPLALTLGVAEVSLRTVENTHSHGVAAEAAATEATEAPAVAAARNIKPNIFLQLCLFSFFCFFPSFYPPTLLFFFYFFLASLQATPCTCAFSFLRCNCPFSCCIKTCAML
jgi:hypothetical protein